MIGDLHADVYHTPGSGPQPDRADKIVTQILDLIEDLEAITRLNEETIQVIDENPLDGPPSERRAHLSGRINAIRGMLPRLQSIADDADR